MTDSNLTDTEIIERADKAEKEAAAVRSDYRKFENDRWIKSWEMYSGQIHDQRMSSLKSLNDYGTLAVRSLFILNGGAILALLTFLAAFFSKNDQNTILIGINMARQLRSAFYMFASGVAISALVAGIAYINWSYMHEHYQSPSQLYSIMVSGKAEETSTSIFKVVKATAIISIGLGVISLLLFIIGAFKVADAFQVIGA